MKKYTILDLVTILGFEDKEKEELKIYFDSSDEEDRCQILKILWDGVHELKNRLAKLKYERLLLEVDEGKRELTSDLYNQAVKAVWNDFDENLFKKNKDIDQIEEVKKQLEKFKELKQP